MDFLKCDEKNPLILLLNASPFKTNKAMRSWSLCIIDLLVGMVGFLDFDFSERIAGNRIHCTRGSERQRCKLIQYFLFVYELLLQFTTFAQLQELSPIYDLNREIMTFNQSYKVHFQFLILKKTILQKGILGNIITFL